MRSSRGRFYPGLTEPGKIALGGTGFVALASLVIPAFGVLAVLIAALLVALVAGYIMRPRVQFSGGPPDRVITGNITKIRYVLKNIGKWSIYNLRIRFSDLPRGIEQVTDECITARLGPGESTEVEVSIRPVRRGNYLLRQPVCESSFPFNLFNFGSLSPEEHTLIALPTFSLMQIATKNLSRHVCTNGATTAIRSGYSNEYAGNRPFMPGDSLRTIDARAWARLSVPATKEYHNDLDHYTALIIDTGVPGVLRSKSDEPEELEAAVSLCASVAFSINNNSLIDMLLAGSELHTFAGQARTVRLDKIHEILAGIETDGNLNIKNINETLVGHFREMSEAFFILLNWNEIYLELIRLAEMEGCQCKVFLIEGANPGSFQPLEIPWSGDIQFLSPDDILSERIKRL